MRSEDLGTTPGPTIVADEGDQLNINVINNGDEPITIQCVKLSNESYHYTH